MSLFAASINSGSNGNCYYVGNEHEAVFIDAGIWSKETVKRMKSLDLRMDKVKAIFISHEHGDHIRGLEGIVDKFQIPVYITAPTLRHSKLRVPAWLTRDFAPYQPVQIGGLTIKPFPKLHDAADPHSFIVSGNNVNIGVITDIGRACTDVVNNIGECDALFLESNYDEEMLVKGRYPASLINRIRGGHGHISNSQAAQLIQVHATDRLKNVYLSHLSKENNHPELALAAFQPVSHKIQVSIASRYAPTGVYTISTNTHNQKLQYYPAQRVTPAVQATLF